MEKHEWSCGHIAGSMCQECFRLLAHASSNLALENLALRDEVEELRREVARMRSEKHG